jgi:CheY-like chemotaxis protein
MRGVPDPGGHSGYALPEDRLRSAAAGFHHHLAKPPALDDLEAILGGGGAPASPDPAGDAAAPM